MTSFVPKMLVDSDRRIKHINNSYFGTLLLKLQWYARIYEETFHVNSSSNNGMKSWMSKAKTWMLHKSKLNVECQRVESRGQTQIDCEQSLFFFRFSKGSAHARERAAKPRDARNEGLSHLAPSVTRVAICVSRVLLDGLKKKNWRDCS